MAVVAPILVLAHSNGNDPTIVQSECQWRRVTGAAGKVISTILLFWLAIFSIFLDVVFGPIASQSVSSTAVVGRDGRFVASRLVFVGNNSYNNNNNNNNFIRSLSVAVVHVRKFFVELSTLVLSIAVSE